MGDVKAKNATISDVARLSGVSMKTVSRVMNGEKYVSKDKKDAVLKVAAELNYRPSLQARGLAGTRSFMMGLFVDDPSGDYVSKAQRGILKKCDEAGCYLVVDVLEKRDSDAKLKKVLNSINFDGVILPPPICDDVVVLNALRERNVPTVRIGPDADMTEMGRVEIDDFQAAYDITEYLISQGHSRIGFIKGDPNHGCSHDRERGYIRALQFHGIAIRNDLIAPGLFSFPSGVAAAEQLLQQGGAPTAIFASNDEMAAGVVAVAQKRAIKVPADLSIVGFDDDYVVSMVSPSITTIRQPIEEMAAAAFDMLLQAQGKGGAVSAEPLVYPYELCIRDSVARIK